MKFFQARQSAYHTNPRLIDDAIYTTYSYKTSHERSESLLSLKRDSSRLKVGDLLGIGDVTTQDVSTSSVDDVIGRGKNVKKKRKFDSGGGEHAEIFMFEYGTVVIWGMTEAEEKRFLTSM